MKEQVEMITWMIAHHSLTVMQSPPLGVDRPSIMSIMP